MIQTEPTPNPESLKFISEKTISAIGTEEFQKSKINEISNSFIKELLGFNGVELILLSKNFLSVKKTKDVTFLGADLIYSSVNASPHSVSISKNISLCVVDGSSLTPYFSTKNF